MFDVKGVLDPIVAIVNKIIPDKSAAAAATAQLQTLALQGQLTEEMTQLTAVTTAQIEVNKVEAANASMFVAGARPAIMWICGAAMLYVSILEPMARFVSMVIWKYSGPFPVIDTTLTMQVLLGLLGLGSMRTWEKVQGVDTKAITK